MISHLESTENSAACRRAFSTCLLAVKNHRGEEESEKAGLKLDIQKMNIMASHPITSQQIEWKKWKQWRFNFRGLQNYYGC